MRRFNIDGIRGSLKEFQKNFETINDRLSLHRERLTDEMRENIVAAYGFLNGLLEKDVDLLTPAGMHSILELNHIVLCGTDMRLRMEYHQHVLSTRKRFSDNIVAIRRWALANRTADAFDLATGFYSRVVSRPQLFFEGNHRTGNLLINYLLLGRDVPPFVISASTAHAYLELSSAIKFSDKSTLMGKYLSLPRRGREFKEFLQSHVSEAFLEAVTD